MTDIVQEPTDASLDGGRAMPTLPLDAALLARTQAVAASLNAEGLRTVAVAVQTLPPDQTTYSVADESGLTCSVTSPLSTHRKSPPHQC